MNVSRLTCFEKIGIADHLVLALEQGECGPWEDVVELSSLENVTVEKNIGKTQTRMLSMLGTQTRYCSFILEPDGVMIYIYQQRNSFGSAVGAPIVFFASGFAYTIADTLSRLGDNDLAHALAFGMW
jgi:hypothetical protein